MRAHGPRKKSGVKPPHSKITSPTLELSFLLV
jgi:hypothetical protein